MHLTGSKEIQPKSLYRPTGVSRCDDILDLLKHEMPVDYIASIIIEIYLHDLIVIYSTYFV